VDLQDRIPAQSLIVRKLPYAFGWLADKPDLCGGAEHNQLAKKPSRVLFPGCRCVHSGTPTTDHRRNRKGLCALPAGLRARRQSSAMLSSPRRPSSTIRIFIFGREFPPRHAVDILHNLFRRLPRRLGFLSHLRSLKGYDEPEILPSSIRRICLKGADGRQYRPAVAREAACLARLRHKRRRADFRGSRRSAVRQRQCLGCTE
jgi:hypothetical protein